MKKLICLISVCLLVASCEKYETETVSQNQTFKRPLSDSEMLLKTNLDQAAQILADVIQDESVMNELDVLSREGREFYNIPFSELMDESKSLSASFRNLRDGFLNACSSSESKGNSPNLAGFLAKNDCYIYCPYPASFYPKGNKSYTVVAHPIDNDVENTGYRYDGKRILKVKVNEEYTDKYMVLMVMPRDEDREDTKDISTDVIPGAKGDPIYEVRIGKVRCADYCGGLFEGELELRIVRGSPKFNSSTEEITGDFNTVIKVNYPRDYAKCAIKGWTKCEGGWYPSNIIWDSNWRKEKTIQCAIAYEYDKVVEVSISTNLGYKQDDASISVTGTVKTTYRGDFLGIAEWDRDWFFATNKNPGPYDEVKDGWTVRKTCAEFKLTTPLRVINY